MKTLLLAALLLFSSGLTHAGEGIAPAFSDSLFAGDLSIRVVKYEDILATPGSTLRCFKEGGKYGYLVTRLGDGDYMIDVISNGKLEGEKSRMRATLKDYETPFIIYLSVYTRYGDYGTYFELLLEKKVSTFLGGLGGDAMFTEAYYSMENGKEKETFKPISKFRMTCEASK